MRVAFVCGRSRCTPTSEAAVLLWTAPSRRGVTLVSGALAARVVFLFTFCLAMHHSVFFFFLAGKLACAAQGQGRASRRGQTEGQEAGLRLPHVRRGRARRHQVFGPHPQTSRCRRLEDGPGVVRPHPVPPLQRAARDRRVQPLPVRVRVHGDPRRQEKKFPQKNPFMCFLWHPPPQGLGVPRVPVHRAWARIPQGDSTTRIKVDFFHYFFHFSSSFLI